MLRPPHFWHLRSPPSPEVAAGPETEPLRMLRRG